MEKPRNYTEKERENIIKKISHTKNLIKSKLEEHEAELSNLENNHDLESDDTQKLLDYAFSLSCMLMKFE